MKRKRLMRLLTLHEYRREPAVTLTPLQRDALAATAGVDVRPSSDVSGTYDLTPGSMVGTLVVEDLQVDLRPKITLDRVLFLVSYALDPDRWRDHLVAVDERSTVTEAMVHLWLAAAEVALRRGALQGYRRRDEALATVRGRIRIEDQLRHRHGLMPPVEVGYDEYTTDIEENRLLRAAAFRVGRMSLRNRRLRDRLARVLAHLEDVPITSYTERDLPEVQYTRLNRHYEQAVELSKLLLRGSTIELGAGQQASRSFLFDMNDVFERFVVAALAEAGHGDRLRHERSSYLDRARRIRIKPDLTWMDRGRPIFVGDVKYKALRDDADARHPDLYQLLAYIVALGLPSGMLIYASGEGEPGQHDVVNLGRQIHVEWLDVSGSPEDILTSVRRLAQRISERTLQAHSDHEMAVVPSVGAMRQSSVLGSARTSKASR